MIKLLFISLLFIGCISNPSYKYTKGSNHFQDNGFEFSLPAEKCEYVGYNTYVVSYDEYKFPADEIFLINLKNLKDDETIEYKKVLTVNKYGKAKYEVLYIKKEGITYMFQFRLGSIGALDKFTKSNTDKGYTIWRNFCDYIIKTY